MISRLEKHYMFRNYRRQHSLIEPLARKQALSMWLMWIFGLMTGIGLTYVVK